MPVPRPAFYDPALVADIRKFRPNDHQLLSAIEGGWTELVELYLKRRSRFKMSPPKILKAFRQGRVRRIEAAAERCMETRRLLQRWQGMMRRLEPA